MNVSLSPVIPCRTFFRRRSSAYRSHAYHTIPSELSARPLIRALHSSTLQLNVSAFYGFHVSTFRLDMSIF